VRAAFTILAIVGSGAIGGVFFAFSSFVMRALARLAPHAGIAAMQSINVVVINPWFLGTFFGTAAMGIAAFAVAWPHWSSGAGAWLAAGNLLYLIGSVGVTMACNVPRNNALAKIDVADPAGTVIWKRYVAEWTAWNHVRTAASLAAATAFCIALIA
jgi:uncharacterized membrane protein